MSVYVDQLVTYPSDFSPLPSKYGDTWCYLYADSVRELERMVKCLRLDPEAIRRTSYPHCMITPALRATALKAGAKDDTGRKALLKIKRRIYKAKGK